MVFMLLVFVPPALATPAYINNYQVSPALQPGDYFTYDVLFHPTVNVMTATVLNIVSPTEVLFNVTLTLLNHEQKSYLQLITVKGSDDEQKVITLVVDNSTVTLTPSPNFSIPAYQFFIAIPLISPYLQPNDFLNLDQRAAEGLGGNGFTVNAFGGDVTDLTYRTVYNEEYTYTTGAAPDTWAWDRTTGMVIDYQYGALPSQMFLVSTNAWTTPLQNVVKPVNPLFFFSNLYFVIAEVFGLFFTYWELWVASLGVAILYIFQGWFIKYLQDRKRLLATPNLSALLDRVNSQEKRVMFLDDRKRSKVG